VKPLKYDVAEDRISSRKFHRVLLSGRMPLKRFDPNQGREAEINDALQQEAACRAALLENMRRLRALRLARATAR
jgi:hypothetical protein